MRTLGHPTYANNTQLFNKLKADILADNPDSLFSKLPPPAIAKE
ncbi:hypothetical protein OYT1_ch2355 [Ferriphaselus amnicola]|uniref:Uncharacterized protein n=1 Tax=Ferriphaselus amnicola TaxID=1188319 RepID=A0A2Z6GEL7_9PROT|nr:hypothetical protein OYT1_ch2355 [Ferriphaselus amnicola]